MKVNPEKCHLLLSSKTPTESHFGGYFIQSSTKETLLGVLIDSELRFDEDTSLKCTKVTRKINALGCIANFMPYGNLRLIMKAFIESLFNNCPLIWMFYSRTLNKKINRFHERALRIAYSDFQSSFKEELLQFIIEISRVSQLRFTNF